MALAVLATVPAATLAGLHYAITVRDGSPLILIPVGIALPFVLRAIVRAWLRSAPPTGDRSRAGGRVPGRSGVNLAGGTRRPLTVIRPQRAGCVTRRAAAQRRTAQPLTRPDRGGIRAFVG